MFFFSANFDPDLHFLLTNIINNFISIDMKRIVFVLLFTVALANGLFAIDLVSQSVSLQNDTTIVFDRMEFDYGDIETGSEGVCVFNFTNTGKEPLMLTNVSASCGCTVPSWTRDPIKPGEKGEIKVKYNTGIMGPFNKSITVNSNGKPSYYVLRIKGKVVPKPAL